MGNKFKDKDIKMRTYYFSDGLINIKNPDPNKVYIGHVTVKNLRLIV